MNLPPRLTHGGRFLRARALWAVVFAIAAAGLRLGRPAPPPRSPEGVAALLGEAVGGEVRPDDFVWEERGGALSDTFLGRRVLFLAKVRDPRGGEPLADLYRARVRLTRAGRPISLGAVRNLSRSAQGDERDLLARGRYAAYATIAQGAVQGVTLLDLEGEGPARQAGTRAERLAASIEAWLETGSAEGIGRVEVSFGAPPAEAKEELSADLLVMALGREGAPAALDLRAGTLNAGARNASQARAQRIPHLARPLAEVLVDATRELAGEAPAHAVAAIAALFQRAPAPRATPAVFPGREPPAPTAPIDDWPPPPLKPEISPPLPGEGVWGTPWADAAPPPQGELPPLYETAIRPSTRQPALLVRLVALDLRRLDLHLQPGFAAPRTATGLRGYGRLPSGAEAEAVVAAFSAGGGVASPGELSPGFAADRQIFLAPLPGVAGVALARDGHASFGAWGQAAELPAAFDGLLQTADPLIGGAGAARLPLPRADQPDERSALGLLRSGHVIYAWGAGIDAAQLRAALAAAGCTYAVPLGGGPGPSGFAYLRLPKTGEPRWQARPLGPEMSFRGESLADGAPGPFFYVTTRSAQPSGKLPAAPASPDAAGQPEATGWVPDGGKQPSPAWIPAIHSALVSNLGAQVHLTTFTPGRMSWRVRAGSREPATKAAVALLAALPEPEQARALAVLSLGFARKKGARGLAIEGTVGFAFRGEGSGILLVEKGRLSILPAEGFKLPPGADATELPLTADAGKLRSEAREVGSMRPRASACLLDDGGFVVASTTFDSDEAATQALLDLGCQRVIALDRGAHAAGFLQRAGTETAPGPRYEPTVLHGLDLPMPGRARRLEDE
jgi:hypothetical protein